VAEKEAAKREKLTLAPLDFEEALRDLLQVPPPPKGEEADTEREPPKRGRKKQQTDAQKG
jgi:hypothetical protein